MDNSLASAVSEAVILAGGLGTRLQSVVKEMPKPMAPIAGKPFLEYVLQYLYKQDIRHVVLSVGYRHEMIKEYFGNSFKGITIKYAVENEPLGTGGGIANALQYCNTNTFLLMNGDSFFDVNIKELVDFHILNKADISLSMKEMFNVDRYGTLQMEGKRIVRFNEKQYIEKGLINGGVYVLNKSIFKEYPFPKKFSFEKDLLECYIQKIQILGLEFNSYFIDIGIPEDYHRAETELFNIVN